MFDVKATPTIQFYNTHRHGIREMTGNEGKYIGDDLQRSPARCEPRTLWFIVDAFRYQLDNISYLMVCDGLCWSP